MLIATPNVALGSIRKVDIDIQKSRSTLGLCSPHDRRMRLQSWRFDVFDPPRGLGLRILQLKGGTSYFYVKIQGPYAECTKSPISCATRHVMGVHPQTEALGNSGSSAGYRNGNLDATMGCRTASLLIKCWSLPYIQEPQLSQIRSKQGLSGDS